MRLAAETFVSPALKSNDDKKIDRNQSAPSRLAADVVGTAARSLGPLAARHRDRRYRPWPGAGGAVERPDQRRAYFLGGAAYALDRGGDARADPADGSPRSARSIAARRAGIRHRRHDLAVQGGAWRRLQSRGEAAAFGDPYPCRIAADAWLR